ncbi:splicing regulator SDE2 [Parambassis ranga]|uniref:Replication stress response regulator SDE2 n=1 Tax=Parambassis ranga TaxID=210632 RepID=A0A6P7IV38_9TELE|nr:replication stress response regulator SDE2 [Parambassis ranga]
MEVFVSAPTFRFSNFVFPGGSVVRDVLDRFAHEQDFYIIKNGRLSYPEEPLQHGAVYRLEPRLCGGKGGFGSMLRALGAQIEKTTNREACRDLSGRRLRDVNHEKEMADWLKKQAEREAEKEQRRLERLQRKLAEPKHQFTDTEYQQQCHNLSERLEDSVLKGLQVSSSGQVKVDDVSTAKRPNLDESEQLHKKQKTASSARFWTGVDELLSSEDEDHDEDSPCTSSCGAAAAMTTQRGEPKPGPSAAAVTMTTQRGEAESRQSSSSSPVSDCSSTSTGLQNPPETSRIQSARPSEDQNPPETSRIQSARPSEDQNPSETSKQSDSSCPSRPELDLSTVSSVQELEFLGLDVLKEELMSRGLKCGGTLSQRAARLFAIKGQSPDQIDPVLLAKPAKTRKK